MQIVWRLFIIQITLFLGWPKWDPLKDRQHNKIKYLHRKGRCSFSQGYLGEKTVQQQLYLYEHNLITPQIFYCVSTSHDFISRAALNFKSQEKKNQYLSYAECIVNHFLSL